MRSRSLGHWILVSLSGITLVLVIVDLFLGQNIRSIQADVNQRQQFINQSIRLNQINQELIRLIGQAVISDGDNKLRDVLARNGITVNSTAAPPSSTAAKPASPAPANSPTKEK
jgi:hypothetical protein